MEPMAKMAIMASCWESKLGKCYKMNLAIEFSTIKFLLNYCYLQIIYTAKTIPKAKHSSSAWIVVC